MGSCACATAIRLLKADCRRLDQRVLIGTIAAVFVYVILHNWALSLIVFAAMLGNQLIANIIGFIVPVVLAKLNMDPALASSMFVTTTTDIVGFFLLLGLATRMMPHLLTL